MCYCLSDVFVACCACLSTRRRRKRVGVADDSDDNDDEPQQPSTQFAYKIDIKTFARAGVVVPVLVLCTMLGLGVQTHLSEMYDGTELGGYVSE